MRVQYRLFLKFFLILTTTAISSAQEQEEKNLNIEISADIVSQYIWRGQDL
jgi:hypothetical protein